MNGWYKWLENERLHYINRTLETNEKVYDELDLKIAMFIKNRREEKRALSAISNDLSNLFELRPLKREACTICRQYGDFEKTDNRRSKEKFCRNGYRKSRRVEKPI